MMEINNDGLVTERPKEYFESLYKAAIDNTNPKRADQATKEFLRELEMEDANAVRST